MIKSIFHINVNVTDFDRSLAFYQMLGFKVVLDLGEGSNPANKKGLGVPDSAMRAALLTLGDDPHATRLDLIEWRQPQTEGQAYPHLYHAGPARIALFTKGIDEEYKRLKSQGVKFVSEPITMNFPNGAGGKFCCFRDPDGTVLELIEPFQA